MNWILLRGLGRESRHWGKFLEILRDRISEDHFFCLDLPGCGKENQRLCPNKISDITDDIRNRWLKLSNNLTSTGNSDQNWGIIGLSLGGMVSLDWCSRYSDLKGAIIINSSAQGLNSPGCRLRPLALLNFIRIFFTSNVTKRETLILKWTSQQQQASLNLEILNQWIFIAKDSPIHKQNWIRQIRAGAQFVRPNQLHCPLFVLASKKDRIVNPRCSEYLANFFKAPLKTHPWSGHDLALDDPFWLAQAISEIKSKRQLNLPIREEIF